MVRESLIGRLNRKVFGYLASRFPPTPWADLTRRTVETVQRQVPRSHAEKYELKTIWYWYPLYCLGGIAFVAFIILTVTGILLGFYYIPDGTIKFTREGGVTSAAFESMHYIMNDVPFGFMIRGLHHWGAHVMIAAVFLHMLRVYFTGAYKKPRELNWLLGVVLMLITMGFGYSGYVLPANDLSRAAATIGINMVKATPGPPWLGILLTQLAFGETDPTGFYIIRMYWIHIFILPMVGTILMILHMALVWVQGVAEPH